MRLIILIALFFSLTPILSQGTESYTVERHTCDDFQAAENWYHNHTENEAIAAKSLVNVPFQFLPLLLF